MIKKIKNLLFLLIVLLITSCNVDRSTIGSESLPEYNYKSISDYEYINNRFFFIDTYYVEHFEKGFSEDLYYWTAEEGTHIEELAVYKSAWYTDHEVRKGVATIPERFEEFENRPSLEGVSPISGEIEVAFFVPLVEGKDYEYNNIRGYISLNFAIKDFEILAVAYRTNLKLVGTLFSQVVGNDTLPFYLLRLVKPRGLRIEHEKVWPLTMKNVYSLGDSTIVKEGFNISIRKTKNQETVQKGDPDRSYLNLTGLDKIDEGYNFVNFGDGKIDDNDHLISLSDRILMFPGLQPFYPLADSRFQLADSNRAKIYNTLNKNESAEFSKYEIVVQTLKN